jgi:polynucleotide 5'-kinase involved in rRNA processing
MIAKYKYIGLIVIGLVAGWTINGWRLNAKIDRMVADHSIAVQRATEKAMQDSQRMQEVKDEIVAKAQEQAQANAAAADSARRERDRLRNDLAASRVALSNATPASLVEYTGTLSNVFEQCTREYTEMAATADKHATDAKLLFDTWQQITIINNKK